MTKVDHIDLLKVILKSNAKTMISGYTNELYNSFLKDWYRIEFDSCAEFGKKRIEVI